MTAFAELMREVRACRICADDLPLGPRPVLQVHPSARILVASQAPGRKVHASGVPFDDASGARLRDWMGLGPELFYEPRLVAIVPMGFCYPGTGASGDLPPRRECAPAWREPILARLPNIGLTLVVGRYAQSYHLDPGRRSLTDTVRRWRDAWPTLLPLPHPSPRNRGWFTKNPWFDEDVVPALRERVRELVSAAARAGGAAGGQATAPPARDGGSFAPRGP